MMKQHICSKQKKHDGDQWITYDGTTMVKDKMLDVEEEKMAKTNDDGLSYEEKYDGDDDAHNWWWWWMVDHQIDGIIDDIFWWWWDY